MKPTTCNHCNRTLRLGDELLLVSKGVVGHRGPLALEEASTFCSDSCAREQLPDNVRMPERVP